MILNSEIIPEVILNVTAAAEAVKSRHNSFNQSLKCHEKALTSLQLTKAME